ncbi:MAG: Rv3654c family TadE-like protein [Nesterenkonia sp.]
MSRPQADAQSAEQGSGTVVTLGIIAALLLVLALVHALSAAVVAKGHAARAADLAALAGADTARGLHVGDPCTVAEQVAVRNGADMEECIVGGEYPGEVRVSVSRSVSIAVLDAQLSIPPLPASADSRAGPPQALPQ